MSAIDQIKIDEGFSGLPYECSAGRITIGYGRNLNANPLSIEEAEFLLKNDLKRVSFEACKLPYYSELSPELRAVIINMIFNLGITGFNQFKKFNKAMNERNYLLASIEMLDSKWAKQVGQRAVRLSKIVANAGRS